jgi:hypothetical protein
MKIGYISSVKDEEDIIESNLYYYKYLGIKNFYIIDHNSTDNTLNLIENFKKNNPNLYVYLEVDKDIASWQYLRMNKLANIAYKDGCNWILPIDADEFLFEEYNFDFNIESWLKEVSKIDGDYLKYPWWNFRIRNDDNLNEKNPIYRVVNRDLLPDSYNKICIKWKPEMTISQGQHTLHELNKYKEIVYDGKIYLAHYSVRSREHLKNKTVNLGKKYTKINNNMFQKWVIRYRDYLKNPETYLDLLVNKHLDKNTELNCQIVKILQEALK